MCSSNSSSRNGQPFPVQASAKEWNGGVLGTAFGAASFPGLEADAAAEPCGSAATAAGSDLFCSGIALSACGAASSLELSAPAAGCSDSGGLGVEAFLAKTRFAGAADAPAGAGGGGLSWSDDACFLPAESTASGSSEDSSAGAAARGGAPGTMPGIMPGTMPGSIPGSISIPGIMPGNKPAIMRSRFRGLSRRSFFCLLGLSAAGGAAPSCPTASYGSALACLLSLPLSEPCASLC